MAEVPDIADQAIAWHLRLGDATAEEWVAFTAWLEADPAHSAAYGRLALDDALLTPVLEIDDAPMTAATAAPAGGWRRAMPWAGGALAASIAAAVGLAMLPDTDPQRDLYAVETRPGVARTMTLGDGTRIDLNGGSRIVLDHGDARYAMLEQGEALFHVRHDAGSPFTVRSGEWAVQDVGTVFNVVRRADRLDVQVAEGSVLFQPTQEAVPLRAGQTLSARGGEHRLTLSRVEPETIGLWRHGRASFVEAPVAEVVAAVERRTGTHVAVSPALAAQPFTGSIGLDGPPARMIPRLATLMGAEVRRGDTGWTLAAAGEGER